MRMLMRPISRPIFTKYKTVLILLLQKNYDKEAIWHLTSNWRWALSCAPGVYLSQGEKNKEFVRDLSAKGTVQILLLIGQAESENVVWDC